MNYQRIYSDIIKKAKSENRKKLRKNKLNYIYYENHHIIPRCLEGSDEKENLVLLISKEHYLCHVLLTYIYPENSKIACALFYMTNNKRYNNKIIKSSREYEYARYMYISTLNVKGEKNGMFGKGYKLKGEKNGRYHMPISEETLKKYKKPKTKEHKKNLSIAKKGKPTWNKNKKGLQKHSQETINKIREKNSGENNKMFNKTPYDVWLEKFGKEIANEKLKKYNEKQKNRTWITNVELNQTKQIKKDELEIYLNAGWKLGRLNYKGWQKNKL